MDRTLGELLRQARAAAGLSQEELAERSGLTVNGISQLERGTRTRPYPHTVRALAEALALGEEERARLLAAIPSRSRGPAASAAAAANPAALPALPTPLIGRDSELAALLEALAVARLLTITGPGGVGKTTLALAGAALVGDRYPGGVCFVPLADLDEPEPALRAVGQALGLLDTGAADVRDQLRTALRGAPRLLVLDNLEQLPGLAPELAAILSDVPELALLATSRGPLRLRAERELPLRPLSLPDPAGSAPAAITTSGAGRLLVSRARAHDPGFEPTDVDALAAICHRLDGLPLAIELAAAWLRVLPPRELAHRLRDALPLLSRGPEDVPARHRTLRDAIAWSDELLEPDQRALFRRLATIPAAWDIETAAAVVDRPEPEVLRGVAILVERSLVQRTADDRDGRARFRLLETVRAYGLEQLDTHDDPHAAHLRLAEAVVDLVDRAAAELEGPDQARWLHRVEERLPDVRAVLRWALDVGAWEVAARCYSDLHWFWYLRHAGEGRTWGQEVLGRCPDPLAGGRIESAMALAAFAAGDLGSAAALAQQAVGHLEAADDRDGLLRAWSVQASIAVAAGAAALTRSLAGKVRQATEEDGGRTALAASVAATMSEVRAALAAGDLARGDDLLSAADEALQRVGNPWLRVLWLNTAVVADQSRGRHEHNAERLRRAVALCQELGDAPALLYTLTAVAIELVLTGRPEAAAQAFGTAQAHGRGTGQEITDPLTLRLVQAHRAQTEQGLGAERFRAAMERGATTTPEALLGLLA